MRLIHLLLFIFSLMIDFLIKQQTAWSQGSSKYQKQKKYTHSEISINLSFYVYIIPKRNNYSSKSVLAIGSSSIILERKQSGSDQDSFITL